MDLNSQRRKIKFKYLYKKYMCHLKKVAYQKNRNLLLKNSNYELHKKAIRLKEIGQEAALRNSNFRTEIDNLATDTNHVMVKNKNLYNTLSSLRSDALAIGNSLNNVLNNSCLKSRLGADENLMPVVNSQVTTKQIVSVLPEVNYQRYNFKGCVHIQDLSPIMEENADRKKFNKPPDITRRLGHRGKVLQQHKSPGSLEASELSTLEGAAETNSVHSSPSPIEVAEADVVRVLNDTEPLAVENGLVDAVAQCPSSLIVPNQLTDVREKESIDEVTESPVVDINLSQQSGSEKACNKDNSLPSIFANVFPRRRKRNDSGFSLSIGDIDEGGSKEDYKEANSELPILQESSSCETESKSSDKITDSSSLQSIIGKSFNDNENNDSEFSAADKSSRNKRTWRASRNSEKDASITSQSSTVIGDETSKVIYETPRTSKRISTEILERSVECSPKKMTSPRNKQDDVSVSQRTLGRTSDQRSVRRSSKKESSISLTSVLEDKQGDKSVSDRISRISAVSTNNNTPDKASLKLLEDNTNLEKSPSRISTDMFSEKRQEDRPCSRRNSARISDLSRLSSGKGTSPSQVIDVKKTLRSKKPLNFAESPLVIDKKRQKKKKK